ncbi:MAG: hypothetical protein BWX80_00680 [Candidatus Hydrogenedentes bacterium ADurb.Bin101]|nr:MAG: hypothetical protein BWX80_00680 [Candidatus Hydrogenedentes bacterium ADurb.Bin101]
MNQAYSKGDATPLEPQIVLRGHVINTVGNGNTIELPVQTHSVHIIFDVFDIRMRDAGLVQHTPAYIHAGHLKITFKNMVTPPGTAA